MGMMNDHTPHHAGRTVVITRTFDAPRALVFRAWTDPRHVGCWWGPVGFATEVQTYDVRPGGQIELRMIGQDGIALPITGVFNEIVAPERLVFTNNAFHDAAGTPGLEVLHTVTFAEQDGKTYLTLRAVVIRVKPEAEAALGGMQDGWNESFDRLTSLIPDMIP